MSSIKQESSPLVELLTPFSMKRNRSGDDVVHVPKSFLHSFDGADNETPSRSAHTPLHTGAASTVKCPGHSDGLPTPLLSPTDGTMDLLSTLPPASSRQVHDPVQRKLKLQQTIQTQLSLEILLKHKEMRLIDQELAKCQVALEQLRRCTEIPYPAHKLSSNVSEGTGPALRRHYGRHEPQSPAPWGVTDGPYTRHYSQWLLSASQFDGGEPDPIFHIPAGKSPLKGRPVRVSFTEAGKTPMKSRSHRGSTLKALPAGYGQPKEKATGPMILKRKSDGVMVKLVCPDCGRHDFGSAQGFINHCRIGHSRSFASHDAAAEACGEPVEYDEAGLIKGVEPVQPPTSGNVHPLIRSARLTQNSPTITSPAVDLVNGLSSASSVKPKSVVSPDFRACHQTPHLSAFVSESGFGLNLDEMVNDAKLQTEGSDAESEDEEMTDVAPATHDTGRHPQTAGSKTTFRPGAPQVGSKAVRSVAAPTQHRDFARPAAQTAPQSRIDHTCPLQFSTTSTSPRMDLSGVDTSVGPDFHQAPSLVDDDDDFEPPSPTSMSVSEDNEVDVRVRDDEEADHSNMNVADEPAPCTQPPVAPLRSHTRRPSAIRKHAEIKEEKHVSFVNTTPSEQAAELARSEQRKRRKLNPS